MWLIFSFACLALVLSNSSTVTATITVSTTDFTNRIAAGDQHTCAISNDDTVWCWGDNTSKQLGSSAHSSLTKSESPVQVAVLPNGRVPVMITAGSTHTCVLASDETAWCWGGNGRGQLGDGTFLNQTNPVQVILATPIVSIAAGGQTTCARNSVDYLWCWGRNTFGQIGNGASGASGVGSPQEVAK
ncbi:MAG: RCC1 domain-containing protein, partial [Ilumatobacteraceae bacterium]